MKDLEKEITEVVAKMRRLRPDAPVGQRHYTLDEVVENMEQAASLIARLAEERVRLRDALAIYGEPKNWLLNGMFVSPFERRAGGYLVDYGGVARAALEWGP